MSRAKKLAFGCHHIDFRNKTSDDTILKNTKSSTTTMLCVTASVWLIWVLLLGCRDTHSFTPSLHPFRTFRHDSSTTPTTKRTTTTTSSRLHVSALEKKSSWSSNSTIGRFDFDSQPSRDDSVSPRIHLNLHDGSLRITKGPKSNPPGEVEEQVLLNGLNPNVWSAVRPEDGSANGLFLQTSYPTYEPLHESTLGELVSCERMLACSRK
jgi:hypothetical protein